MIEGQFIWSVLTINLIHDTKIQVPVMVRSREKAFHVFKNLLDRPDFKFGDITDPIYIKDLVDVDYIIHVVSVTASKVFMMSPVNVIRVSVEDTKIF